MFTKHDARCLDSRGRRRQARGRHAMTVHVRWFAAFFGTLLSVGALVSSQEPTGPKLYNIDEAYLRWPLLPEYQAYSRFDGNHLKQYVAEQSAISRRSRDAGNQYWGRIAGTP